VSSAKRAKFTPGGWGVSFIYRLYKVGVRTEANTGYPPAGIYNPANSINAQPGGIPIARSRQFPDNMYSSQGNKKKHEDIRKEVNTGEKEKGRKDINKYIKWQN
jgi:hypothetical protein